MPNPNGGPGRGHKKKKIQKNSPQQQVIKLKELEPDQIVELVKKIESQPAEYRPYLYEAYGFKTTFQKYRDTKVRDKQAEQLQRALYPYFEDYSLFKARYCQKQLVEWQEETLRWIRSCIARGIKTIVIAAPRRHGKTEGIVPPLLLHVLLFNRN